MTYAQAFAKLRAEFSLAEKWDYEIRDMIRAMITVGVLKLRRA